jgi:hypothetical protein
MAATVRTMQEAGRCELCGAPDEGTFRSRIAHMREQHPAYARGVLFRVIAPFVFLASVLILAAAKAPTWGYIVVLGLSFGLTFFGRVRSRSERTRAGTTPTIGVKRLLREGGLGFILIVPVVAVLIVLLSR